MIADDYRSGFFLLGERVLVVTTHLDNVLRTLQVHRLILNLLDLFCSFNGSIYYGVFHRNIRNTSLDNVQLPHYGQPKPSFKYTIIHNG